MVTGSYLSIINLNIYGLNAPTKRQKLAEWMQKTRSLYMLSTRDPPQNKGHIQTESEGQGKIFHANGDQKKAGVAIFMSDKIVFKTKTVKTDKEGHYIMINGSIQEEDITIINICTQHRNTTICKTNSNKKESGN